VKNLISKIFSEIKKDPSNYRAYEDIFSLCRTVEGDDFDLAHKANAELRTYIPRGMQTSAYDRVFNVYKRSLLFDAPYDFDSYLLYLEINRKPEKRFYQPRRRVLKRVVDQIQLLVDDKLDELFISMPPRTGKTTTLMLFATWMIGRNSDGSNLYSSYSDTVTSAFYSGVLEVITDPVTYLWKDVFPEAKIVQTNAANNFLNIDRQKRFPSLTCRSLYGTLNGACDCDSILIADDLISGIEEALNKDRLKSAWDKVDNNLLPRAKETAKILWCGTRWSMVDPSGMRADLLENDKQFENRRFATINLPALDEDDESVFDYDYGVGFSTEFYRQRRASFERNNDMASWLAQYMGEPIEREGALFTPDDFRYYNGELPTDREPDRIIMAVDPAFGGGDFVSGPVGYQYGNDVYMHDVVYDDRDKRVTVPLIVNAVILNGVQAMQVEANKSTEAYKEEIEEELKKRGHRLNITTKSAPTNTAKFQRIFDKAPEIRENVIFREPGRRSKEYSLFMQNLFSYKLLGKNKNDDAPDSLAMLIDMIRNPAGQYQVFKRPF